MGHYIGSTQTSKITVHVILAFPDCFCQEAWMKLDALWALDELIFYLMSVLVNSSCLNLFVSLPGQLWTVEVFKVWYRYQRSNICSVLTAFTCDLSTPRNLLVENSPSHSVLCCICKFTVVGIAIGISLMWMRMTVCKVVLSIVLILSTLSVICYYWRMLTLLWYFWNSCLPLIQFPWSCTK